MDVDNPAVQAVPGQLSPEVLVRFTSPGSYEVLDQSTLVVIDTGVYDPATGKNVFPTDNLGIDYGYQSALPVILSPVMSLQCTTTAAVRVITATRC